MDNMDLIAVTVDRPKNIDAWGLGFDQNGVPSVSFDKESVKGVGGDSVMGTDLNEVEGFVL